MLFLYWELKLSSDEETLEQIAGGKYRVIFGSAEAVLDERFRKVLKDYRTSRVDRDVHAAVQ